MNLTFIALIERYGLEAVLTALGTAIQDRIEYHRNSTANPPPPKELIETLNKAATTIFELRNQTKQ